MERFAVISDIHGNLPALEAVTADISSRNIEHVINLGDHFSGPLWPAETAEFLIPRNWITIAGNHDRQLASDQIARLGPSDQYAWERLLPEHLDWLKELPATLDLDDRLRLLHGAPTGDKTYLLETIDHGRTRLATVEEICLRLGSAHLPVLLCGHTHVPRVIQIPNGPLIINPGSVGLPAYQDDYLEQHITETGSPHARYVIAQHEANHWLIEIILIEYDWNSAARQAQKNHRKDWEIGLRTGFMQEI